MSRPSLKSASLSVPWALIALFAATVYSLNSFAGGGSQDGGGGVGYACGEKVYLADTYGALHGPGKTDPGPAYQSMDPLKVAQGLLARLKTYDNDRDRSAAFAETEQAMLSLRFKEVAVVPPTNDANIATPPAGCTILQLARQDGDGLVELAPEVKKLPVLEQALLLVHEGRLRFLIQRQLFQGDTTAVRSWLATFMRLSLFDYARQASTTGMLVQQDTTQPSVCYRGSRHKVLKLNNGEFGPFMVYNGRYVTPPSGETTPAVEGEECPPLKTKPSSPSSYAQFYLSEDDRKKMDSILSFYEVGFGGVAFKRLDRVPVGTCVLSSIEILRNYHVTASVAQDCSFEDVNNGKKVTLRSWQPVELEIRTRKLTGWSGSTSHDFILFDIDAPIAIVNGATDSRGNEIKPPAPAVQTPAPPPVATPAPVPAKPKYKFTNWPLKKGGCVYNHAPEWYTRIATLDRKRAVNMQSSCFWLVDEDKDPAEWPMILNPERHFVASADLMTLEKGGYILQVNYRERYQDDLTEIYLFDANFNLNKAFGKGGKVSIAEGERFSNIRVGEILEDKKTGNLTIDWQACESYQYPKTSGACRSTAVTYSRQGKLLKKTEEIEGDEDKVVLTRIQYSETETPATCTEKEMQNTVKRDDDRTKPKGIVFTNVATGYDKNGVVRLTAKEVFKKCLYNNTIGWVYAYDGVGVRLTGLFKDHNQKVWKADDLHGFDDIFREISRNKQKCPIAVEVLNSGGYRSLEFTRDCDSVRSQK